MPSTNQRANVLNNLKVMFIKRKKLILFVTIGIVLIVVVKFVYDTINKVKKDKTYANNNEFLYKDDNKVEDKTAELILFWANWCPHSTEGKKEWDLFEKKYNGSKINNTIIIMYSYQCDKEGTNRTPDEQHNIDKYKIEEVPTVILVKGKDDTVEMKAKLTTGNLKQFLEISL